MSISIFRPHNFSNLLKAPCSFKCIVTLHLPCWPGSNVLVIKVYFPGGSIGTSNPTSRNCRSAHLSEKTYRDFISLGPTSFFNFSHLVPRQHYIFHFQTYRLRKAKISCSWGINCKRPLWVFEPTRPRNPPPI